MAAQAWRPSSAASGANATSKQHMEVLRGRMTKADDMQRLFAAGSVDARTGVPQGANASMLLRRLEVYTFPDPLAKPHSQVPYCAHCFAHLILPTCRGEHVVSCRDDA